MSPQEEIERLRMALAASGVVGLWDWMVNTDLLHGDTNFARLYGLDADQVLAGVTETQYQQHVVADDLPALRARIRAVFDHGADFLVEYRIAIPDQPLRWIECKGSMVYGAEGQPVRFSGTAIDITERKAVEASLHASDESVRRNAQRVQLALAAGAIMGTWFWDIQADKFTIDDAFAHAFGLDPALGREDISLTQIVATVHPDDQPGLAAAINDAVQRGGPYVHQYRTRRADGKYHWLEANGRVEHAADGTPLIFPGVLIDLQQRRKLEAERDDAIAALREANDQLRAENLTRARELDRMWSVARDPLAITDMQGRLVAVNPAWTTTLGWTESELLGTTFEWLEHPEDQRVAIEHCVGSEENKPHLSFEHRLRTKAGDYRTLSWACAPEGGYLYCSARDVTEERSRAEELVERTLERDRMWENSPDLMLVIDFDGVFRRVNPAWTSVLGYRADELVGRHVNEFVSPDHHQETIESYELATRGGNPRIVNRYRHKNGSHRWISWTAAPQGNLIYATGRDVTAERERAEELEKAQEALRQSQKMDAIGQLTGGVAHDFNNLLTIIRSSVDLLRRSSGYEERRQRYLNTMSDTVDRAARLTGQLLAFARRQALRPEVFDVGKRLLSIGAMLDTVTGNRIQVSVHVPQHPCLIRADVSQFETALVNMAVNARDAMQGEGQLMLSVECHKTMPSIRGHAASKSFFSVITVKDTGCGILEDHLSQIFEPFFTTKEVGKGTGLGLSQVFGFAKQSGGDVAVESQPGEGTTFSLYLPETDAAVSDSADEAPTRDVPVGGGQRILVVEDNIDVGRFCTQILQDLGYETVWAANAEEALARLDEGRRFDAVFSDVVMPGMGGMALAKRLRETMPALPVILASGYSDVLAREDDHGFELLQKPYSAEQVARLLQRVILQAKHSQL